MKIQKNGNGERDFTVELTSNKYRLSTLPTDANDGIVIEGTLGKLQHATFVEPEILEIKGSCGVLRVNLRRSEITVIGAAKKKMEKKQSEIKG